MPHPAGSSGFPKAAQGAVWQHSCIRLGTKLSIYRSLVSSVLLYGAHSWAPSRAQLERLEKLQRSQLRRILGRSKWQVAPGSSRQPRLLSNARLYELCNQLTIAEQLQRQRGRWVGHLLRMGHDRLALQLLFGKLESTAPPTRTKPALLSLYCSDIAQRTPSHALRKLEAPNLLIAAQNKTEWSNFFP
jgi:hypothetical protein